MDLRDKADNLNRKFDKITQAFQKNIDLSTDAYEEGENALTDFKQVVDVLDYKVEDTPEQIDTQTTQTTQTESTEISSLNDLENANIVDIVRYNELLSDFEYFRETLRDNIETGRKILHSVSTDILAHGIDDETLEGMSFIINSFTSLNQVLSTNLTLYVKTYKEITQIAINIKKIKEDKKDKPKEQTETVVNQQTNVFNILSTSDLIKSLKET